MKKLIIVLCLAVVTIAGFGQGFKGFLFPVEKNTPKVSGLTMTSNVKVTSDSTYNTHLIRFDMDVGGVEVLYNKVDNSLIANPFLKVGIGLSYSFFRVTNGIPFRYLSINGFVFLPITESNQLMSFAATLSSFTLFKLPISPGVGLNFTPGYIKSDYFPVGPLVNLKYNF